MIKIDATVLYWMVMLLEQMKASCRLQVDKQVVKEVHRKEFLRHLELTRNYAEKLSLSLTQKQADRLAKDLCEHMGSYEGILAGLTDLATRFSDELVLYHVPSEHQDLFEYTRRKVGDEVLTCFPETRFDIEEGGKCLALGRGTACVFHLSRVIERGLCRLSMEAQKYQIVCPDPGVPQSWDRWLNPIEAELNKERKQKTDDWSAVEPSYGMIVELLRKVSAVWRHPTLPGESKYTVDEARDIFDATYEFMRYMATARFS